jgi:hypothetical protein
MFPVLHHQRRFLQNAKLWQKGLPEIVKMLGIWSSNCAKVGRQVLQRL